MAATAAEESPQVVAPVIDGREVPQEVLQRCYDSHDSLHHLRFREAEQRAREAIAMYPHHALPHLFLAGVFLYEIQQLENFGKDSDETIKKFYRGLESALKIAEAQHKIWPDNAYPRVYLGVIWGTRGMVKVYQHSYFDAYFDGKRAAAYLQEAMEIDKENNDAYYGLGQFEYYCSNLAGVLQFVLRLEGDEEKGIAWMRRAAERGTYAKLPARAFLSQVYAEHRNDWKEAKKFVYPLRDKYPENMHYARYTAQTAQGLGFKEPENIEKIEALALQWDSGWRGPGVEEVLESARLDLATHYLTKGQEKKAMLHLEKLTGASTYRMRRIANNMIKTRDPNVVIKATRATRSSKVK